MKKLDEIMNELALTPLSRDQGSTISGGCIHRPVDCSDPNNDSDPFCDSQWEE